MAERKQCEFQLIRYVPDPVKNEFVNIGVLLRAAEGEQSVLRFTRDWGRVRCLDPDADTQMLEALEIEIGQRLRAQPADHPKPIMALLEESLSNGVQITETKAYLAESFLAGLEDLMRLYVDTPRRERSQRRGGRAALHRGHATHFEEAGVWTLMRKQIAAANYTKPGDPLRIDCGYRPNGVVTMFQAISLESRCRRCQAAGLQRAGPHGRGEAGGEGGARADRDRGADSAGRKGDEPDEERIAQYRLCASRPWRNMTIRVLTSSDLPRWRRRRETARFELKVVAPDGATSVDEMG